MEPKTVGGVVEVSFQNRTASVTWKLESTRNLQRIKEIWIQYKLSGECKSTISSPALRRATWPICRTYGSEMCRFALESCNSFELWLWKICDFQENWQNSLQPFFFFLEKRVRSKFNSWTKFQVPSSFLSWTITVNKGINHSNVFWRLFMWMNLHTTMLKRWWSKKSSGTHYIK